MGWEKIKRYFQQGLWDFSLKEKRGWNRVYYKLLRIAALSVRAFHQNQCSMRASALTYYTLMSLVPVLAMAFAVAGGFGMHQYLQERLLSYFHENQAVLSNLFSYSDKLLEQTKGGILAVFSIVLLIYSVTLLISNMERALNHIWGVRKLRSWRRLFTDYSALMLIAPLFFLFASALTVWISHYLEAGVLVVARGSTVTAAALFLIRLIPYAMFWILFGFIYLFLPNTKVRVFSAFLGGFVAGTLYLIVQWGYIYFQVGVARYGSMYGSLAALPLFLVWIQLNWFLLLFGAEISFAHQTHEQREFEPAVEKMSYSFRKLLALWITQICIDRFMKKWPPISVEILMETHQIPYSIATLLLHQLALANILIEVKDSDPAAGFIPNGDVHEMRVSDVIFALENHGTSDFPQLSAGALGQLDATLKAFREKIETCEENLYLLDL
ncbi:MAG: YihY/virulence factor BrkB family protein [Parachlamydiales bacterium]|nr:YihY/virulence factor BrkB family protein [Parachlamydiales bacterium]